MEASGHIFSHRFSHKLPYILEKQRRFPASPQDLTSGKLFLGDERQFQSFKALPAQQSFFLLTLKRLNLKGMEPVLQKKRQFHTHFRHLRGKRMHQFYTHSCKFCHKAGNLTAFFYLGPVLIAQLCFSLLS